MMFLIDDICELLGILQNILVQYIGIHFQFLSLMKLVLIFLSVYYKYNLFYTFILYESTHLYGCKNIT